SLLTGNDAGDGTMEMKPDYIEVTPSTSLEDPSIENSLSVFPNPTNGKVNLSIDLKGGENLMIELFDLTGRKLADLVNATSVSGTSVFTMDISKFVDSSQVLAFRITVDGEVTQRMVKFDR
ncbi:MAG: T9SS type A sorting domain-containing protein, partial [Bacteroidota bacterium]